MIVGLIQELPIEGFVSISTVTVSVSDPPGIWYCIGFAIGFPLESFQLKVREP